jgi:hypothetical protein
MSSAGCQVTDLNAVFSDPMSFNGKRFCGDVVGVPQRTGITFFPSAYEYSSRFYDTAMFLDDRNLSDRLRLSQTAPFRIHLEGIIRPAEDCFSREALEGAAFCTPTRRPITLRVTSVGEPRAEAPSNFAGQEPLAMPAPALRLARASDPIGGAAGEPIRAPQPSRYVYVERGSQRAEVFDLDQERYADAYLRPDGHLVEGDFGGALFFCNSREFNCLESGLNIAVPKTGMRTNWATAEYSCRARPVDVHALGRLRITCRANRGVSAVAFTYSPENGVLSYSRSCPQCRSAEYELVGADGLFPQPDLPGEPR